MQLLGFYMLGWRDAERQHDVAELIDYLHQRLLIRSCGGSWQGRRQSMLGELERTAVALLTQCIPLPTPKTHSPNLQDLIANWHEQEYGQALVEAGQWMFMQLPRFQYRRDRITKTRQQYHITSALQVPIFCHHDSLDVQWRSYTVAAYIRHHGALPSSGHYTTLVAADGGFDVHDDHKIARRADASVCAKAGRDIYILVLARAPEPAPTAALPVHLSDSVAAQPDADNHTLASQSSATIGPAPSLVGRLPESTASSATADTGLKRYFRRKV